MKILGLLNRVKQIVLPKTYARKSNISTTNTPDYDPVSDFGGSRTSIPKFVQGTGGVFGALPKKTQSDLGLDDSTLSRLSVDDLITTLIDAHPDVSYAVWNFLRLGNSGYTLSVSNVDNDEKFEQGELEVKSFIKRLAQPNIFNFELSRHFDKVINQLMLSTIVRGACSLEMVLTSNYDDVAFLAPVDTATIDFKYENGRYIPYQDEETLSLDIPTFLYEGLDELIDDPYGRSPLLGAINAVMFQLQILNDLKAVVHNQGYPRFDITIIEEVLLNRMPISIRNNEEKKQKWLNQKLADIINMYNNLNPDDSFVHFNSVEVDMVGGGKGGTAMIDPEKLMHAIDNLIMAGLKTLSTILGRRSTGNTESFAKMEIKLYMKGVEAIQGVVERLMSRALTLFLNIKGMQGVVNFKFKPMEIRTSMETAQFEQIHLINCQFKRDQGWISQDEAAMLAVGHSPVADAPSSNVETPDVEGNQDEKVVDDPSVAMEE